MISINQKWCQKGNKIKISDEKFLFFSFDFGFFAQIKIIFTYEPAGGSDLGLGVGGEAEEDEGQEDEHHTNPIHGG